LEERESQAGATRDASAPGAARQDEPMPDAGLLADLDARRAALGDDAPRFLLVLCECGDVDVLAKTLSRIPHELESWLRQVIVMVDRDWGQLHPAAETLRAASPFDLRLHRPLRGHGPGALRKAAFEYALLRRFDHVIVMRGDASHPPERLPELVRLALADPGRFVLASRMGRGARGESRAGLRASTFLQNRILGLRLEDYRASFRLYPCEALARIPFQLDADDDRFDVETLLQLRALGIPIEEAALIEETPAADDAGFDWRACGTALDYRLHQLHVTRNGRYLVDRDIHYTLKRSPTSSHAQIVDAIEPGRRVLDLGCSNGLLARPLREKDVEVIGVDSGPGERLSKELAGYCQHDLEQPLDLPLEREFDYVVCADVIEHLRNRAQLLRGARRYLKPEGRLILSTPNVALWFYRLSLLVGRFEYGPRGVLDETHVHLYTCATIRREVEKAGFTILRQRATSLPFEVVFESTGRSRLVRGLDAGYHRLARAWPSMFAYQVIVEAQISTLDEEPGRPGGATSTPA
jgi:2-polyprenyl-3-methyl-5-hydroxy-6-metoxy-1,4-benzoquinol methylase